MEQHKIEITWDEFSIDELPPDEQEVVRAAEDAIQYAYAPYSGYRVGASSLCKDGSKYPGANQENYTYSATAHAEEVSLHNAAMAGKGDQVIKHACLGAEEEDRHVAPCGHCLIRMAQYEYRARQDMVILFGGAGGKTIARIVGVKNLMPTCFVPEDLGEIKGAR